MCHLSARSRPARHLPPVALLCAVNFLVVVFLAISPAVAAEAGNSPDSGAGADADVVATADDRKTEGVAGDAAAAPSPPEPPVEELVVFDRVRSVGWSYVVRVDDSALGWW